jgi:hypothetical protein
MSFHSSRIGIINKVIHVNDEVFVVKFFAYIGFDQTYHLFAFVEVAFSCLFCLIVCVFISIKLQKSDKVIQKVFDNVKVCPTNIILLIHFFEKRNLFSYHQVVKTH